MKKLSMTVMACLLALMIAVLSPLTVFVSAAENTHNNGKYISEVRVGMGESADEAAASLAGYTILSEKGLPVDLNQKAGGGWGSKGEKVVYLGYKTTDSEADAITDLAVMNMKGGYSVQEYEALFDSYIKEQIEPLIDRLSAALEEYRVNYGSENESNRQRAVYVHDALNKLIDDDTEKGLGDLLLNRTKYEMGGEAYDELSDTMKNNTADIVTILCQANGTATLTLENLIARAADTSDDTWIDRFAATTYDDLIEDTGLFPTDAEIELVRLYDDDARKILASWNDLRNFLADYEEAAETIDGFDVEAAQRRAAELEEFINNFDESRDSQAELLRAMAEHLELTTQITKVMNAIKLVGVHDFLYDTGYGNGTLLDFFSRSPEKVELTELYPLAASLSRGQKAGLDFISLLELITIAMTDGAYYNSEELENIDAASIYEGVDRGIYQKGGVALTTQALRDNAMNQTMDERAMLGSLTIVSTVVTGAAFIAFAGSLIGKHYYNTSIHNLSVDIKDAYDTLSGASKDFFSELSKTKAVLSDTYYSNESLGLEWIDVGDESISIEEFKETVDNFNKWNAEKAVAQSRNAMCKYLGIGFGVALFILTAFSVYSAYSDLVNYYNVEYTPIPRYMVDEKDITAYNAMGEKIFIKNQTAYYKAAECNRMGSDEMYGSVGIYADLNGDVGSQWLALYSVKQEPAAPILAGSLKAVVGKNDLPAEYTTGIHMFGSTSAFNLNSNMYVWNGEAPSVYVYFNVDSAAKRSAAGSLFAGGGGALAGGIGFVVGALAVVLIMSARKKSEEESIA